jgi:hypothetical protein
MRLPAAARLPRFKLPGGRQLPPGVFPEVVKWTQGVVDIKVNLLTGDREFTDAPKPGRPSKTFRVIRTSRRRPQARKFRQGIVTIDVMPDGLTFEEAKPRPAMDRTFRTRRSARL